MESGIVKKDKLHLLLKEANELTEIFTASGFTAKSNKPDKLLKKLKK
jgi:hypothetical protein